MDNKKYRVAFGSCTKTKTNRPLCRLRTCSSRPRIAEALGPDAGPRFGRRTVEVRMSPSVMSTETLVVLCSCTLDQVDHFAVYERVPAADHCCVGGPDPLVLASLDG